MVGIYAVVINLYFELLEGVQKVPQCLHPGESRGPEGPENPDSGVRRNDVM